MRETDGAPRRIHGRVLDVHGDPVAAVAVGRADRRSEVLAHSAVDGSFDFELERGDHELVALAHEWATVRRAGVRATNETRDQLVIVAPAIDLAGRVVESSNRAVAGAHIKVVTPHEAFAGFPYVLEFTSFEAFEAKSHDDGSFSIDRAPAVAGARLVTEHEGFENDSRALPLESTGDLLIELEPSRIEGAYVEGLVVHEDRTPATKAEVHLAGEKCATDSQGRFRLKISSSVRASAGVAIDRGSVAAGTPLVAIERGYQAAVVPDFGRVIEANDQHPPPMELVLGPPPLSIAGHVIDAEGRPCKAWNVNLLDATEVSQLSIPLITAEDLTLGVNDKRFTDAQGAFEIGGLLRGREYRVQAWSGSDLTLLRSPPIAAGRSDVVLQVPRDAFFEKIAGRVVTRDGAPLEKIAVTLGLKTLVTSFGSQWTSGATAMTKSDGSFEFSHVPRASTMLSIDGDAILPANRTLADVDPARPIEIVALRRCHFRIEAQPGERAPTSFAAVDRDGRELSVWVILNTSTMSMTRMTITDGKTPVVSVSEEVRSFLFYRDDQMLSMQPVTLSPDEIAVIRL